MAGPHRTIAADSGFLRSHDEMMMVDVELCKASGDPAEAAACSTWMSCGAAAYSRRERL